MNALTLGTEVVIEADRIEVGDRVAHERAAEDLLWIGGFLPDRARGDRFRFDRPNENGPNLTTE